MPRIRSLKPEIFCSPQVMNLSRDARLLLIGSITQADDEGRGSADPRKLKATIFPGDDDMTPARIAGLLDELVREKLMQLYDVAGCVVYVLPTWGRHQRIDRPSPSRYPPPPATSHQDSTKNRRSLVEPSSMTRQGSDGSDGSDGSLLGGSAIAPPDKRMVDTEFEQLRAAYPRRSGALRWAKARFAINARLREGDTFDAMLVGVQKYAAFCAASGDTETKFVQTAARFFGPERAFAEEDWGIRGGQDKEAVKLQELRDRRGAIPALRGFRDPLAGETADAYLAAQNVAYNEAERAQVVASHPVPRAGAPRGNGR